MKPDALWPAYNTIERETSMTEQKRRFEDQLPSERLDWERGGEPSGDPIRVERQQALLNYAAAMLKADGSASLAVAFPDTDPTQYVMIGAADDILGLLPVPGATDGLLRAKIRDIVTLLIERQDIDHLLDDPDLVRLVSALTAIAVRVAGATSSAAPAAGQAGLATELQKDIDSIADELEDAAAPYGGDFADTVNGCAEALRQIASRAGTAPTIGCGGSGKCGVGDMPCLGCDNCPAAPVAADTEQARQNILDAHRYRWLRSNNIVTNVRFHFASGESPYLYAEELDKAIDHNMGYAPLATPADAGAGLKDEQLRETDGYKLGWMEGMQEGAELATGGEKSAADVEAEFAGLLPGSYYMDPPDGGSPSVLEQVSRMAEDAAQWRAHIARLSTPGAPVTASQPELTVWYGSLPESNGKSNFTATLRRKGASMFDTDSYTFSQSEYPGRVQYDADAMRYLIGELSVRPCPLDYDDKAHSGYVKPEAGQSPAPVTASDLLSNIVANAVIQPDEQMEGKTDCYAVPLDDIEAARKLLGGGAA